MRLFRLRGAPGRPQNLLLALALATAGFLLASTAQAQVAGTSHDLTTGSTTGGEGQQAGVIVGAGDGEICAYCHTPHGGDTEAPAPLWNRSLTDNNVDRYSDLATTTLQGDEAPVGSISLACLSCHDGVQAMDTVINAPGRGPNVTTGNTQMSATGDNTLAVIGTDLRDDHPVSIQYCGGGIDGTQGTPDNTNCAHGTDYNTPQTDSINGNQVWWLDTTGNAGDGDPANGSAGTRERTDIFLYSRADFTNADGTSANLQPAVECGSCHDPHVASPDPDIEVNFMRISNEGSNVCLTCHNK